MRCPYCGGLNQDSETFCRNCGRDLNKPLPRTPVNKSLGTQPPRPTRSVPSPAQRSPYPPPQPPYPVMPVHAPAMPPPRPYNEYQHAAVTPAIPPVPPVVPAEPEAPAPFPPRTLEQLRALEQGARDYTLVSDDEQVGRKRIVRVSYPYCPGWQQLATLYKVLLECKQDANKQFETVIVQGVLDAYTNPYSFNNGQLIFDRHVRLGSEILNRYQLETGNGFAGDAIRVVLTEVVK